MRRRHVPGSTTKAQRYRRQQELLRAGAAGWESLGAHQAGFRRCERGPGFAKGNVQCRTCGRTGSPWDAWVVDCIAGHPFRCHEAECPRAFTTIGALASHRRRHERTVDAAERDEEAA